MSSFKSDVSRDFGKCDTSQKTTNASLCQKWFKQVFMISATKLTLKWYLPCYPSNDFYFFQWTVMQKIHTSNPKLCSSCPLGFLWNQEERERKPVQMSKGLSFWRLTSSNLPWNHYEDSTSMTMTKNDQADILPLEFWFQSHKGEVIPGFHCKWFMLHFFLQMWSYALENCKLETCQRNDSGKRTPQVQFHFYIIFHSSAKFNSGFGLYVLLRSLQDILGWWLGWLWSILRNLWLAGE